jgi:beta-lactamase class A
LKKKRRRTKKTSFAAISISITMTPGIFRKQLSGIFIAAIIILPGALVAQKSDFKTEIEAIAKTVPGTVGVAIMDLKTKEALVVNEKHHFPMQSVFKFPLAMAVLDQVDKGKLSLTQKYHVTKEDVQPKTHSPLRDKYPDGNVDVTLADLLTNTVSLSDNIACDILFKLAGGTKNVQSYIHGLGIKDIAIVADEAEMSKNWNVQYTNWCEPKAMSQLLDIFYQGNKLSKTSHDFLWKIMVEGPTGLNRIKGLLPQGTVIAHKTGTSGSNEKGMTGAVNDAGIMKLPNGKNIAVVVFVSNSTADTKAIELVIARVAKAAWDHYSTK